MTERQVPLYLAALAAGALLGAEWLETALYPVLGALLYATFAQVPFTALKAALADRRFVAAALGLNFVLVPPVAYALSRAAPGAAQLGVLLVLLAPCVDYVIVFTRLAGGSADRLLATTPLLMGAQIVLLPGYLWLLADARDVIDARPFVEAFALLIALPLALAWLTEAYASRRVRAALERTPVPLMALTLLVVAASQVPRIEDDLGALARLVPVYVAFLVVMPFVGGALARALRLPPPAARALVFTGATRNSLVVLPLALAVDDLTSAAVVTQTLVEVLGMVVYVRVIPRLIPWSPK